MTAAISAPAGTDLENLSGTWELDGAHSTVGFVARYLRFSRVRGSFTRATAELVVAEDPERSSLTASLDAASIDTGNEQRDGHLRSADFFDVENHPSLEFRSTGWEAAGEAYRVRGDLTIRGVTRPVELRVEYLGRATDPFGRDKLAFTAATTINRDDWGLTWNQALEAGGFLVSKTIDIEIDGQLIHRAAA